MKKKQMKILKTLLIAGLCIGVIVPTVAASNAALNNKETNVVVNDFGYVLAQNTNLKIKGVAVTPILATEMIESNIITTEPMLIKNSQLTIASEVKENISKKANETNKAKEVKNVKEKENKQKDTNKTNTTTTTNEARPSDNGTISLGTFKLTAYCSCSKCCGKWSGSPTASGAMPKANHTIAVDTSVISFGTKVLINGNTYVAEDTGSGINGNKIDIYFNSHQDALNFGVQYSEVFVYD